MTVASLATLYERIETWKVDESDFNANRQLADELLLLDGWTVAEDTTFEGGFRWSIGNFHSSESTRPHPLYDLNAATGLVPFKHGLKLERPSLVAPSYQSRFHPYEPPAPIVKAWIWGALPSEFADPMAYAAQGMSSSEPAAICAAFVKWKWMEAARG